MKLLLLALVSLTAILFSCNDQSSKQKPVSESKDTTATALTQPASERPVHWSYVHEGGPAGWAELSPAYAACGSGKSQSPVDLLGSSPKANSVLTIDYKTTGLQVTHNEHVKELINNGHTLQVTPQSGSSASYGEKLYHLKQFHFHTPSEHTLDGKHFPMEVHFVHESDDKSLLVIGVFVKEGKHNKNFDDLVSHLPKAVGENVTAGNVTIDLALHIPTQMAAYHYVGSLTTPPCTENVQWMVLRSILEMSKDQLAAFSSRMGNNNRPTQPLNNRPVIINDVKNTK